MQKDCGGKIHLVVVFFCGLILSFFIFLSLLVVSILFLSESHSRYQVEEGGLKNDYKYLPRNIDEKFNLEHKILKNEDVSFFTSQKYRCTGFCYCENTNERRSSGVSSTSRVFFLMFASISSIIAIKKAKEYLFQECLDKYSEDCVESITSEIDECFKDESEEGRSFGGFTFREGEYIFTGNSNNNNNKEEEEEKSERENIENKFIISDNIKIVKPKKSPKKEKKGKDIRRFWCIGKCLSKTFRNKESIEIAKKFDCQGLEKVKKFDFDCGRVRDQKQNCNFKAKKEFQKTYLRPFCKKKSSKHKMKYQYVSPVTEKSHWVYPKALCVASKADSPVNPSVHCHQLHPKYKPRGVSVF